MVRQWLFDYVDIGIQDKSGPVRLDSTCCSYLMRHIVKHILFMKQQIPCMFDELESDALMIQQMRDEKKRVSVKQKNLLQVYNNTVSLFETCEAIFESIAEYCTIHSWNHLPMYLCLVIGGSVNTGSEFFVFKFHVDANTQNYNEARMANMARNVMRSLITSSSSAMTKQCQVKKTHLLCYLDRNVPDDVSVDLSQYLIPKQQLVVKIKLPKQKQRVILENESPLDNVVIFEIGSAVHAPFDPNDTIAFVQKKLLIISPPLPPDHDEQDSVTDEEDNEMADYLWFLAKSNVKGFKLPSTNNSHDGPFM